MGTPQTLQKRTLGVRCSCPHGKRREPSERRRGGASGAVGTTECSSAPVGSADLEGFVSDEGLSCLLSAAELVPFSRLAK